MDFASALYLGMRHPSTSLGGWGSLTTGAPAALFEPPGAERVARSLAELTGCGAGALFPSTLHLFLDLFAVLSPGAAGVAVDAGAYAVARWGVERARCAGVPAAGFRHHDAAALGRALRSMRARRGRGRPLVVCDGFCPGCGRPAPLADYLAETRAAGGILVIDDTQALGIWGARPGPSAPYGSGGGGSLRRAAVGGGDLVVGASLAKGFGAPVALLAGSAETVRRVAEDGPTRAHSSPPSTAEIRAAARALAVNAARGDALRARLADRVARFRRELAERGVRAAGGRFPVQTLAGTGDPAAVHGRLAAEGIRAVLRAAPGPRLTFLLRADHTDDDLARAAEATARAAALTHRRRPCRTETTAEGTA